MIMKNCIYFRQIFIDIAVDIAIFIHGPELLKLSFNVRGVFTGTGICQHHPPLMFTSEIILDPILLQKAD